MGLCGFSLCFVVFGFCTRLLIMDSLEYFKAVGLIYGFGVKSYNGGFRCRVLCFRGFGVGVDVFS